MGTIIRMKAEVVNPELLVVTEQGILPYYAGTYINKLAEKGVTLTQTEINAVTAFINSLIESNVIDKIGTFYPFMGDVNVPLIGSKELEFDDTTQTNTNLDFVNGKLRGIKGNNSMPNVKYKDLTTFTHGFNVAGSMITKSPTSHTLNLGTYIKFSISGGSTFPNIQMRFQDVAEEGWRMILYNYRTSDDYIAFSYNPAISDSDVQKNYSFMYALANENSASDNLLYNRTLIENGTTVLSNVASNDTSRLLKSNDITEFYFTEILSTQNVTDRVVTSLAFFNEIPTSKDSLAFCKALDTFTAAVGKTVAVK